MRGGGANVVVAIHRADLLRFIEEEAAQVVDVLPDREHVESHIPGAISIPLRRLNAQTVSVLTRGRRMG